MAPASILCIGSERNKSEVAAIDRPMHYFDHIVVRRRRRSSFVELSATESSLSAALQPRS